MEEIAVGRHRQFAEAMLGEFLRHFLCAVARHFHLVERLHRAQARGMAGVAFAFVYRAVIHR